MDATTLAGWSDTGRAVVDALRPRLVQRGATWRRMNHKERVNKKTGKPVATKREFRLYLPDDNQPVAQLVDVPSKSQVKVRLTVGEHSPLLGDKGSGKLLARINMTPKQDPKDRDRGHVWLTLADTTGPVAAAIDAAYRARTGRQATAR